MLLETDYELGGVATRLWLLNALRTDTGLRAQFTKTPHRDEHGREMLRLRPVGIDQVAFWVWFNCNTEPSANPVKLAIECRASWAEWQRKVARGEA